MDEKLNKQTNNNTYYYIIITITITMNPNNPPELNEYLKSLSVKETKAYEIAKSHLGMTYQYDKTIGFIAWKHKQDKNNT